MRILLDQRYSTKKKKKKNPWVNFSTNGTVLRASVCSRRLLPFFLYPTHIPVSAVHFCPTPLIRTTSPLLTLSQHPKDSRYVPKIGKPIITWNHGGKSSTVASLASISKTFVRFHSQFFCFSTWKLLICEN